MEQAIEKAWRAVEQAIEAEKETLFEIGRHIWKHP